MGIFYKDRKNFYGLKLFHFILFSLIFHTSVFAQQPGNVLKFDGTNDYVVLPNGLATATTLSSNNGISIEYWFKGTSLLSAVRIQNANGYIVAGYGMQHIISTDGGTSGIAIPSSVYDGRWHHIAMTWQKNTTNGFRSYVDGQLVAQRNSANTSLPTINSGAYIGSYGANGDYTNGSIDEVRIYNTAISQTNIQYDMINGNSQVPLSLLAYYQFNQGVSGGTNSTITSLRDTSGKANHGLLTNFALTGTTSNWTESYAMVVPTANAASNIGSVGFTANWSAPIAGVVNNYFLDVSSNPDFSGMVSGYPLSVTSTTLSQSVQGLLPGTYYYRIRANKTSVDLQGAVSNTVSVTVPYIEPGNALAFDGVDDYVSLPNGILNSLSASSTIETWFFWNGGNGWQRVFDFGNNRSNYVFFSPQPASGDPRPLFQIYNGSTSNNILSSKPIISGKWYHLAITINATTNTGSIYLNGELVGQNTNFTLRANAIGNSTTNYLGKSQYDDAYFNGKMDEFRIWNIAKTQSEIQTGMKTGAPSNSTALIANYKFNQGIGAANNSGITTLTDSSLLNLTGTIINYANSGSISNWVESYAMVIPTVIAASGISTSSFTANWIAPSNGIINNYIIDVATDPNFTNVISGSPFTVSGNTTFSKTFTGLQSNLNYYYRIRADRTILTGQGAINTTNIVRTLNALTPPGNCLAMDGVDDYVIIPTSTGINNQFANNRITLETWVYLKSLPTGGAAPALITEGYNGAGGYNVKFAIYLYSNGLTGGFHDGGEYWTQANYNQPLPLNRWTHIACTYDQNQIKLYMNGVVVATKNTTATLPPGSENWFIGKRWDFQETINGSMDEVRIYNDALSASDIQSDMRDTTSVLPNNLVAYYNFDQGSASGSNTGLTILTDRGNAANYNANLTNIALTGANSNYISSYAMVIPTVTNATLISANGFTANWLAPKQGTVNGYLLDVSTSSDFTGLVGGSPFTLTNATFSQSITGLLPGTYYYRVRATNSSFPNQGGVSNTMSVLINYSIPGNALAFDGSGDVIVTPISTSYIDNFTMEAWVNPSILTGDWQTIFAYGYDNGSYGNGVALYLHPSNGRLYIQYPAVNTVDLGVKIDLNRWSHVAMTRNLNGLVTVYLNGQALSVTGSNNPNGITGEIRIGGHTGIRFLNGKEDEFRFWTPARTAAQINANYKTIVPSNTAGLLVYYNYNQGVVGANNTTTNVLLDQTANGNNGSMPYFSLTGNTSNWVESYAAIAPIATNATAISNIGFTTNWTAATQGTINNYYVEVSTTPDFSGPIAGSPFIVANNATSRVFSNMLGGTYYYRVSASKTNMANQGAYSNIISVDVPYTPPGNALAFDGINDWAVSNTNKTGNFGTSDFTIEYWLKTTDPSAYHIQKRNGCYGTSFWSIAHGVSSLNQNQIYVELNNGYTYNNSFVFQMAKPINDGRWHHLAMVRQGVKIIFYVDGDVIYSQTTNGVANVDNSGYMYIANSLCNFGSDNSLLNGSMDEVRLWNIALSKDTINTRMRNIVSPNTPGLITYYNFDQGVGGLPNYGRTVLFDVKGNADNNMNLANIALEALNTNYVESYATVVATQTEPTNITPNGFTLNWNAPPNGVISNYFVDVSLSSNFTAPISGSPFNVNGNSLTLSGLASSTFYCRVRANNSSSIMAGEGAPSNVKIVDLKYVQPGNALKFDGTDDYATIPKNLTSSFTVEFWMKSGQTGTGKGIIGTSDFGVSLSNGKIVFNAPGATLTSIATVNTDKWFHVAITRNGSQLRLYINGVQDQTTTSGSAGNINNNAPFTIGSTYNQGGNSNNSFNGAIDELRIWNVERTFTEIPAYYKDTIDRNTSNLLDYYNFDQGIGGANNTGVITLKDIAGTDNAGTISNFALSGAASNWVNTYNIGVTGPNTLTASNNVCGTIDLNWQIPSSRFSNCEASNDCDISDFKQFIYVDDSVIAVIPASATNYSFNVNQYYNGIKLVRGINYKFIVRTAYTPPFFSYVKTSLPTNIAVGKFKDNPDVPPGFSASILKCDGSIDLGWSWNGSNPQNGFIINRSDDSSMSSPIVYNFPGAQRSYSDAGLQRGKFYYYHIFARNDCYSSSAIDTMFAGVSDTFPVVGGISPQVPLRPTNVRLFADSTTNVISISWNDNSNNEDKFGVERSAIGGITTVFDVNPNDTFYNDESAAGCVAYNYTVRAYSGCATTGIPSIGLNQTRLTPNLNNTFDVDTTVYHLKASKGYYPDKVELNWNNRNRAQLNNIRIYRKVANSTNDSILIASVLSGSGLYIDNSTVAGILYRYYLIGEMQCAGVTRYSNMTSDIGFRSPSGIVSGTINYAGGFAVQGVRVLAQNTSNNKGGGIAFDGVDDYMVIPHQDKQNTNTNSFTVEAWFKPLVQNNFIIATKKDSANGGYILKYDSTNNQLQFIVRNSIDSQMVVVDNPFVSFTSFNQITAVYGSDSIRLYVNGIEGKTEPTTLAFIGAPKSNLFIGGSPDLNIYGKGNMDEFRLWRIAKTKAQITTDFNRTVEINDASLIAYLNFDDRFPGLTETYDQSNLNLVFNENHARLINGAVYSDSIPNSSQLATAGYTDAKGTYSIPNVRYLGTGQNYTIVPNLDIHSFSPNNSVIFVGDGNQIINNINFTDNSSFEFVGTVRYAGTTCPATGAFVLIDDQYTIQDNHFVNVNDSGKFVIRVPIGNHTVSLKQDKHLFSQGNFPERGNYDFRGPVSAKFVDSTFLTVVGRVAGGNRELNKLPGLGRGKNNIGKAQFTFNSVGQSGLSGCFSKSVVTNDSTGEYTAHLLPLRYNINGLRLVNNPDPTVLTKAEFNNPNILDLTTIPEITRMFDTLVTPLYSRIDSVSYHKQLDFKYYTTPVIYLTDTLTPIDSLVNNFIGTSKIKFNDSLEFDITNNQLGYPVFYQFDSYYGLIKVIEKYENIDLPLNDSKRVDRVPVKGNLRIYNNLASNEVSFSEGELSDDYYFFRFRGGEPNLLNSITTPQYNFTKTIQIEFVPEIGSTVNYLPNKNDLVSQFYRGYLLGSAIGNSYFTSTGPKTVDLVLRDPPGSASSATWTKGVTYSKAENWNISNSFGNRTNITYKNGVKVEVGVGLGLIKFTTFETRFDVTAEASFSKTMSNEGSIVTTITSNKSISTGSDPGSVGSGADVYFGTAQNIIFGNANQVAIIDTASCRLLEQGNDGYCSGNEFNGFKLANIKSYFVSPGGVKTTFAYTQDEILNLIIPDLEKIRNQFLTNNVLNVRGVKKYAPVFSDANDVTYARKFGSNNDDPIWGGQRSTSTVFVREASDSMGPSYIFHGNTIFEVDSIRYYNNQIRLWKNAIARNEAQKYKALNNSGTSPVFGGSNISLGKVAYSEDFSSQIDQEYTENVEWQMDESIGTTFGLGSDAHGFDFDLSANFSQTRGASKTNSSSVVTTFAYTLQDGDDGDLISVDVVDPKDGNSHLFKLRSGRTSCPYEGKQQSLFFDPANDTITSTTLLEDGFEIQAATAQNDLPIISVDRSNNFNVPASDDAIFILDLGNLSEGHQDRTYSLRVNEATNPYGAILKVDGLDPNRDFDVPYGTTVQKTLTLKRGASHYDYDNIQLILKSQCDDDIFDTVSISAHFLPTCTSVNIKSPDDRWVLNNSYHDTLPVVLGGYNYNWGGFKAVHFQYKPGGTNVWYGEKSFYKDSVGALIPTGDPNIFYPFNFRNLPDGNYELKAETECIAPGYPNSRISSTIMQGLVDRVNPTPFGTPSPSNGILSPGNDISIQFNEPIEQSTLSLSNFEVKGVLNKSAIRSNTSLYFDGDNDYLEVSQALNLQLKPFTIEFWHKRGGLGQQVLFSQGADPNSSFELGFDANNKFYFRLGAETVTSNLAITDTTAYNFLAVAYNSVLQTADLYIGEQVVNIGNNRIFNPYTGAGKFYMGKASFGAPKFAKGNLYEVRLWSLARTLTDANQTKSKLLNGTDAGLVANWRMDEATGNTVKDYARSRNATIINAQWFLSPMGKSYTFDGNGDYITVSTTHFGISKEMDFTLEFWFKGNNGNRVGLLSNGTGEANATNAALKWSIETDSIGRIMVKHNGINFLSTNTNYFDGNWHHLAFVLRRNSSLSCYVDANLQNSMQSGSIEQWGGSKLWFGAKGWNNIGNVQFDSTSNHFNGQLDDLRFWNSSRLIEQIKRDKNNRLNGDESGLVLYVPFESYQEVLGFPVLNPTDRDVTSPTRKFTSFGDAVTSYLSPTLKLPRAAQSINFTYGVNGDKIIITPTTANEFIENVTLDITVKGINDKNGNVMQSPKTWIAYVDRNQVKWQDDSRVFNKETGAPLTFQATIINSGGALKEFTIGNLPSWLKASVTTSTINPSSSVVITFTVDPTINIGKYEQDLTLNTDFGFADKLLLKLNVYAVAPSWSVNTSNFSKSMSIVGQVRINNVISANTDDMLGAFVNNECRGVGKVQYYEQLDKYLVFMDVYGNNDNEQLEFRIWNSATGKTHVEVDPSLNYVSNTLVGSVASPQIFNALDKVSERIVLNQGWNWVSFNLLMKDSSNLNQLFSSIKPLAGNQIKNNTEMAIFDTANGWSGNLANINAGVKPENSYLFYVGEQDTLELRGVEANPTLRTLNYSQGWNYLGFVSQRNMSVSEALADLNASQNDLIKGQTNFAVYDTVLGWVGSLTALKPNAGYLYKSSTNGSFNYPRSAMFGKKAIEDNAVSSAYWSYNPHKFANNMSVIGKVNACTNLANASGFLLGAFVNGELRGYINPQATKNNEQAYFLNIAGNEDENISFKLLDESTGSVYDLNQNMSYKANVLAGSVAQPFVLTNNGPCVENKVSAAFTTQVYPVPFTESLTVEFNLPQNDKVSVRMVDISGKEVAEINPSEMFNKGAHQLSWKASNLPAGVYILEIVSSGNTVRHKVVKL